MATHLGPLGERAPEHLRNRGQRLGRVTRARTKAGKQRPHLLEEIAQIASLIRPAVGLEFRRLPIEPLGEWQEVGAKEGEPRVPDMVTKRREQPRRIHAALVGRHPDWQPLNETFGPDAFSGRPEGREEQRACGP